MEQFANGELLRYNKTKDEYLKSSKIVFECFDSFLRKSEQLGKFKIDQWAQIQTVDGRNAISNLLSWTYHLNVSFPIFNNFVFKPVGADRDIKCYTDLFC